MEITITKSKIQLQPGEITITKLKREVQPWWEIALVQLTKTKNKTPFSKPYLLLVIKL